MYLFYLDESGDPNSWDQNDNFVLAGVAVHEGQVRRLSEQLDNIQREFFPSLHVSIELHAHHIHAGRDRFRSLNPDGRKTLLQSIYNVIGNAAFPNLISFITSIHVSAVRDPSQALRDCLEDICQRFNTFLVRQFKNGYKDKGLLIMDKSGREMRIRELMIDFEKNGTKYGYLGNIMDVPYFCDSAHTRMVQMADFVAFAAGRYLNSDDRTYLDLILDSIDRRGSRGEMVGLKHIVADKRSCSCVATH